MCSSTNLFSPSVVGLKIGIIIFITFYATSCLQDNASKKKFAAKLYQAKICTANNYNKLKEDINYARINNPIDFLNYCDHSLIITLDNYPDQPESYLEKIHKTTSSLLRELSFTDFKFKIVLDSAISDSSFQAYNVITSLKSHGRIYQHRSYINTTDNTANKETIRLGKIDEQEYYKIFNKILSDIQSPFRLHLVKNYIGNVADYNKFGIIMLTKEQADLVHDNGASFDLSYESFKNSLTSEKIDSAIAEYQKIGLLSHLTDKQIAQAKENVAQQENQILNQVLHCFPNLIYTFDTELNNLKNPNEEILIELARISRGAFIPSDIVDTFDKPINTKARISFSINGKLYTTEINANDDWIDPAFFKLINQAVTENISSGEFYELYGDGQDIGFIFLTKKQANYLYLNKLLVFSDQWQSAEE
ncbi:hypothetical protein QNI16_25250 [Cytophagaceae bacterium YF14B1]|uniref:Uncharacterized protein n=1 Tax=Xanthocytophaga flava TaxID=3048013 RepID=A0AAE3QQW8_9BACT|nr:hypothetical protein [Xanthocytophaga flavus]MDJ1483832.1 hypothetical protein [Xanthocytophaga flavus]